MVYHCRFSLTTFLRVRYMTGIEQHITVSRSCQPVQSPHVIRYAVADVARFANVQQVGGRCRWDSIYAVYSRVPDLGGVVYRPVAVEGQNEVHVRLHAGLLLLLSEKIVPVSYLIQVSTHTRVGPVNPHPALNTQTLPKAAAPRKAPMPWRESANRPPRHWWGRHPAWSRNHMPRAIRACLSVESGGSPHLRIDHKGKPLDVANRQCGKGLKSCSRPTIEAQYGGIRQ